MKRKFSIIKRPISMEEKKERLKMYNMYKSPSDPSVDPIGFLNSNIYDETIHLKCTKCKYEEIADYEIIEEITLVWIILCSNVLNVATLNLKGLWCQLIFITLILRNNHFLFLSYTLFPRVYFFCLFRDIEFPNK